MSYLKDFKEKITDLVRGSYKEIHDITDEYDQKLASILMEDTLEKEPIETEKIILKHVSIDPESVQNDTSRLRSQDAGYKWDNSTIGKTLTMLYPSFHVEILPKTNLQRKNVTYLDTLNIAHESISEINPNYYADPLTIGQIGSDVFCGKKSRVFFEYEEKKTGSPMGFLILSESDKNKNEFAYPRFKDYVAPAISFNIFKKESEYHLNILNNLYEKLK